MDKENLTNDRELEKQIEDNARNLKHFEAPPEIWFNIESEINKLPEKKSYFIKFTKIFYANKLRLSYSFAAIIIIFTVYFLFSSHENLRVPENSKDTPPLMTENKMEKKELEVIKRGSVINNVPAEKIFKVNSGKKYRREKEIAGLEKKASKVLHKLDPYTKTVCENKLQELDESISECKNSYSMSFNESVRKSLSMVYDRKAELLLGILKMNL